MTTFTLDLTTATLFDHLAPHTLAAIINDLETARADYRAAGDGKSAMNAHHLRMQALDTLRANCGEEDAREYIEMAR